MNGKVAGTAVIAYGTVSFVASLTGLSGGVAMCVLGPLILVYLGTAVYNGSRQAGAVAIFVCAIHFVSATGNVVSAAVHGIDELGAWTFGGSLVFGTWALLNMALLAQFRGARSRIAETGDLLSVPISAPPPPPFQFSLRSMFVLTVLVALGSALGTRRPLPTNDSWGVTWSFPSNGGVGLWDIRVAGYRSGRPAVGYLWRSVGTKEARGPTRVRLSPRERNSSDSNTIEVDGVAVQPSGEFQLFVNDSHDNPMRLVIPKKEAMEVFGRSLNMSRIEKFWNEVVEPQRANPPATSAGGK